MVVFVSLISVNHSTLCGIIKEDNCLLSRCCLYKFTVVINYCQRIMYFISMNMLLYNQYGSHGKMQCINIEYVCSSAPLLSLCNRQLRWFIRHSKYRCKCRRKSHWPLILPNALLLTDYIAIISMFTTKHCPYKTYTKCVISCA